jgi:WS/DGAT C-terminal domain
MGLNITVMSYCGHLDFGIVADREQMRDVWRLIDWLEDSLRELLPDGIELSVPDGPALGAVAEGSAAEPEPPTAEPERSTAEPEGSRAEPEPSTATG